MRKVIVALAAASILTSILASPAPAFEGGGRKPSEAPLIAVGQHYAGQLTNHKDDANFGGVDQVAIWRLPPLSTRDVIYVDWHSLPLARNASYFPVCMTFGQGIDDFNWGTRFDEATGFECESGHGPVYTLSGSGTARTAITVPDTNANSSYLEFYTSADRTQPSQYETFPYDFTLEAPLHYLGVAIRNTKKVNANGLIEATATLASGLPAPDGLPFSLSVTWNGGGSASYTGVTRGGVVAFQLALPETAYNERGTFYVGHPADGSYVEAVSRVGLNIKEPKPLPPSPCQLAERHELALARQFKRLKRHASHARGRARAHLHRRAAQAKRRLHAAHLETKAACGLA
jgi:hypothetical protein